MEFRQCPVLHSDFADKNLPQAMEVGTASGPHGPTFSSGLGRSEVGMGSGTEVPGTWRAGMLCWQQMVGGCSGGSAQGMVDLHSQGQWPVPTEPPPMSSCQQGIPAP